VALALSSAVLLSGCGSGDTAKGGTTVKGTLLSEGKPLEVNDGTAEGSRGYVRVIVALNAGKDSFSGEAKTDGTFTIEGVKPGEYTLSVMHHDTGALRDPRAGGGAAEGPAKGGDPRRSGQPGGTGPGSMDKLGGEFSPEKSQIKIKVGTSSPQDVGTIDLKKSDTWPK
jgi:hypothetical protein